jgi:hypothetical protein
LQEESAIVEAICIEKNQQGNETNLIATDWLCEQHYAEVELLVRLRLFLSDFKQLNRRATNASVIAAVNTLPLPIAEEIVPHVATLW